MTYVSDSDDKEEFSQSESELDIQTEIYRSPRLFYANILPILPYFTVLIFLIMLFIGNFKFNCSVNRAFHMGPSKHIFKIINKKRIKIVENPIVKYNHSCKYTLYKMQDTIYSSNQINKLITSIKKTNEMLHESEIEQESQEKDDLSYDINFDPYAEYD